MRDYELTLVINPEISGEERKKLLTQIKKIVEGLKGKIGKTNDWGKKELAYPIKKQNLGYYFLLVVKLPEKAPSELDKKLRLEEKIMRFLLVKREKTRN